MLPRCGPVQGPHILFVQSSSSVSCLTLQGRHVSWARCHPRSVPCCFLSTTLSTHFRRCVGLWVSKSAVCLPSLNRRVNGSCAPCTHMVWGLCPLVSRRSCVLSQHVPCMVSVMHALTWGVWGTLQWGGRGGTPHCQPVSSQPVSRQHVSSQPASRQRVSSQPVSSQPTVS